MSHERFKAGVEARDLDAMKDALADGVTFWTPVTYKQYEGKEAAGVILQAVLQIFEDFRYTDELTGEDSAVLVFEAKVGDKALHGIDLLHFDADGLIDDFKVMVRPLSATLAVRDAMGKQLGVTS